MSPAQAEWLRDLPLSLLLEGDVRLSHGTPDNDQAYCLETVLPGFGESGSPGVRPATPEEVQSRLGAVRHSLVLCGHTHVPRMAQREGTLIVNPGSVGLQAYDDPHPY